MGRADLCRFAVFAVSFAVVILLSKSLCSLGVAGPSEPIHFELVKRHGWLPPALNSRHVQHKDTVPAPAAKVYDPGIVATFPAFPAYQHRARAPPHCAV